jgi:hypothetical protein
MGINPPYTKIKYLVALKNQDDRRILLKKIILNEVKELWHKGVSAYKLLNT